MMTSRQNQIALALCVVLVAAATNCKTVAKPSAPAAHVPSGAPPLAEILADLRADAAALADFRAAATFTLESPKLKSVQKFPSGTVAYRRPADLYIVGKNNLNATLFKLTSRGADFLIEFPAVQDVDDRYYCSTEADDIANVPFPVAPADVAHEMFQPIDWAAVTDADFRYVDFDKTTGEVTLEVRAKDDLVRRIVVSGKPWCIAHNTLTDASGATLCDTTMSGYVESAGARIPTVVDAQFPGEGTRIRFELRNVRANTGLPGIAFTWNWPPGQ